MSKPIRVNIEVNTKGLSSIQKLNNLISNLSSSSNKTSKSFSNLGKAVLKSTNMFHEWWKRFGEVAFAFTIMYRSMNLIENGIKSLISYIKETIKNFDEFTIATYKSAMMYQFFGDKVISFGESLRYATNVVTSLKIAMIDSLASIKDVSAGLDELAQNGVFITDTSKLEAYANLFGLIGMIATTTGSSAKQVRQEIQALFQGVSKPGNLLLRFVKSLAREGKISEDVIEKLKNVTTAHEALEIIIDKINPVIRKFNRNIQELTVEGAVNRLKKVVGLLSEMSLRMLNIVVTGNQLKNAFADIFTKSLDSIFNESKFNEYKNKLEEYNSLLMKIREMKNKGLDVSNLEKEASKMKSELKSTFEGVFTEKGRSLMVSYYYILKMSYRVINFIASKVGSIVETFSAIIVIVDSVYEKYKSIFDVLGEIVLALISYKASMFVINKLITISVGILGIALNTIKDIKDAVMALIKIISLGQVWISELIIITGLVATIHMLFKKYPKEMNNISESLQGGIGYALNEVGKKFVDVFGFISRMFVTILEFLRNIGSHGLDYVIVGIMKIKEAFLNVINSLYKFSLFKKVFGIDDKDVQSIKNELNYTKTMIKNYKEDISNWSIGEAFSKSWKNAGEIVKNSLSSVYKNVFDYNSEYYEKMINKVSVKDVQTVAFGAYNIISNGLNTFINKFGINVSKKIKRLSKDIFGNFVGGIGFPESDKVNKLTEDMIRKLKTSLGSLYNQYKSLYDNMKKYNILKVLVGDGEYDINQVKSKVFEYIDKYKKVLIEAIKNAKDELDKNRLRIEFAQLVITEGKYKYEMNDFVQNFKKKIKELKDSFSNLTNWLSKPKTMDNAFEVLKNNIIELQNLINQAKQNKNVDFSKFGVKDLKEANDLLQSYIDKLNDIQYKAGGLSSAVDMFLSKYSSSLNAQMQYTQVLFNWFDSFQSNIANVLNDFWDSLVSQDKKKKFKDFMEDLSVAFYKSVMRMVTSLMMLYAMQKLTGLISNFKAGEATNQIAGGSISADAWNQIQAIKSENGNVLKGGIKFFANGGVVNKPTLGIVGEGKYSEAVVPLPDGRHISAVVTNSKDNNISQPIVINLNIQALDAQSFIEYEKKTGVISKLAKKAIIEDLINNGGVRNTIKRTL